ncbi:MULTISPECIES: polyprenyl synthetase family protein [Hydrogenophaga]|jgi:farnesyl diphosphate synthase|uniref:Farnesyl diphosphate synthase n=1 Tax=Hydrogenophaga pseudoflava TaxID=47421 RepID=A0A4P6WYZ6_HYDPS|nr:MULTISPECIES: farnesyl diphosphate synthase [Hydrogenophaga]QBM27899.1 Farnesyl diphosphate synthase [Hydrogenophaga pseudoflava]
MSAGLSDNTAFVAWRVRQQEHVEQALSNWVLADAPAGLGLVMRYAVLDGGKRLRPLLALAACEAVQGDPAVAMRAACAVELIHAYSLVHDDMPCMDNDVLRRGKPTVHVKYGEAQALLAGDALQALAFELLVPDDGSVPAALSARLCRQLAVAAGASGMAGGQAVDLASVGVALDQKALEGMHRLKTGALLQASVMMGASTAALDAAVLRQLSTYGACIGLAFQVVDDILDVTTDSATLGKTAGKDAAADKPTFVSLMGLESAQAYADEVLDQAHQALSASALPHTDTLHALADWVGRRAS